MKIKLPSAVLGLVVAGLSTAAAAHPFTAEERGALAAFLAHQAHGTPETAVRRLAHVADATGADELMLVTPVYALAARPRSYELVMQHATDYSAPDSKSSTK